MSPRTKVEITTQGLTKAVGPRTFIAPRTINEHLIHYNERGQTTARIAGEDVTIPSGALFWVQPGVRQEVHLPSGKAWVWFLRFRFGSRGCWRLRRNHYLFRNAIRSDSLLEELRPPSERSRPLDIIRQRSVLVRLLCEILQHANLPSAKTSGLQPHQQRQCLQYIHEHLARRYPVSELAKFCQLNPAYLTLQFQKSFGMTPQAYIKQARVKAAAGMLQETGRTISQVADDLGYTDVYFFSRQFRQVMGQSPRPWRARHIGV